MVLSIDIYDKDEQVDLSKTEKTELTRLIIELKKHAKTAVNRRSRKKK